MKIIPLSIVLIIFFIKLKTIVSIAKTTLRPGLNCYKIYVGFYEGKFFNLTAETDCKTNCLMFKIVIEIFSSLFTLLLIA